MQLKGLRAIKRGPVPLTGRSIPLTGALFNCLIVSRSPRLELHRSEGPSKRTGLARPKKCP